MDNLNGYCVICGASVAIEDSCELCDSLADKGVRALTNGIVIIHGKATGRIVELDDKANRMTLYYGTDATGFMTDVYTSRCDVVNALMENNQELILPIFPE